MAFVWEEPLHADGNYCISPDGMRAWEAAEMARREGASHSMMEVAGREVAMAALRHQPETALVFCGPGNNGGDGFVAAHYLRNAGCDVRLFIFCNEASRSPEALRMFGRVLDLPRTVLLNYNDVGAVLRWKGHRGLIAIDAIYGTGYRPAHSQLMANLYKAMENLECPVLSVDIASGIDASTGFRGSPGESAPPRALHADETVTFGAPKIGHFCGEGPQHTGTLRCVDIGLGPWTGGMRSAILCDSYVDRHWPVRRKADAHKGMCGHVFVVGGSESMPGAACLASRAAMRAGAGLVTAACAADLPLPDEIMRMRLPASDLPGTDVFSRADVILAGPGLGRSDYTIRLLELLCNLETPMILDADALWALPKITNTVASKELYLTPHPGEAARLLDVTNDEIVRDLPGSAMKIAEKYKAVVILKSHVTHIAIPKHTIMLLPYPNPAMATAGCGDVLAGILSGILAQARTGAFEQWLDRSGVAAVAASAHSRAGRRLASLQATLTASELIQNLQIINVL